MSMVNLDRDPHEKQNVLASRTSVAESLATDFRRYRQKTQVGRAEEPDEPARPSKETLERLKALGYIR